MMTLTEIKKFLYKENPTATIQHVRKDGILYQAQSPSGLNIQFFVPFNELGETIWNANEPAKFLIRYIQSKPTNHQSNEQNE